MKKCPKCNLLVDTNRKTCPLCYEILKKTDDEEFSHSAYPEFEILPTKRNIFIRILTYLTIMGILTSVIVNVLTYRETKSLWSIIVILALGYSWILIKGTIIGKGNMGLRLFMQMLALSVFVVGIDIVIGFSGWSINFVIPFLSMASILSIIFVFLINRVNYSEYLMYLFDAIIFGFIPFILWICGIVNVLWPSLAAACLSIATIVGLLIFADRETREEMKKRFHI